ncbi:MAG: phosphoribosylformylglycinamidine synthase I [Ignavibacteria bacterium GWB2_35_12]|nr:MAG: phosphoribosylformylglycinamidine synthase I [Ignavibacteria bacterium GWB2_35_12]OGU93849.1 MAG: phosphoribosylformylglycinamidine synthase I [Ignavibacteria bacterium RIFOXYA2_FULL_35_10]OGV22058.1 MAG: phosphoribosylformylglycinamidine synthase I [Ignavibacteria bacterium RIFOXYC2_FULL_35_21]
MKFGIVVFPGSNCDHDAYFATKKNAKQEAVFLWHKDTSIPSDIDCVILPGGFSYGDYLRCGAIARFSPIMNEVISFANKGGYVLGICNGFQTLTEAGLLPGTLLRNKSLNFVCADVNLKVMNNSNIFTSKIKTGDVLRIPIAHGEGNYFADDNTIAELESNNQITFKYCDNEGNFTELSNPNGSMNNIAGIINKERNILGMMPHPERYSDKQLGCNDGIKIFESIADSLK